MSKLTALLATPAAALLLLTSCTSLAHDPKETYILVTNNAKIPYWQTANQGLIAAGREMKVKIGMLGPDTYDTRAEHDAFQDAVRQKPSGILISASDVSVLAPDINSAIEQGIPVITVDA